MRKKGEDISKFRFFAEAFDNEVIATITLSNANYEL